MINIHKLLVILLLLSAGAFLRDGILEKDYFEVGLAIFYIFLAYINPVIWNDDGR
jgi:hypothetical protein